MPNIPLNRILQFAQHSLDPRNSRVGGIINSSVYSGWLNVKSSVFAKVFSAF